MRPTTLSRTATAAASATRSQVQLLSRPAIKTARCTPPTSRCLSSLSQSKPQQQHRQLSPQTRTLPIAAPKTSPILLRTYHSYDHPPPLGPFNPTEETILSAAYAQVPEHGFSAESLAIGARSAGYLDISTTILPEGTFSLIRYHLVKQREALAARRDAALFGDQRQNSNSNPTSISAKVEVLTWERLQGNTQVISRWQEVSKQDRSTNNTLTP